MSDELPPLNVEWTNVFTRDIAGVLSINLRDEVLRILNMLSQTIHKSLTFLFHYRPCFLLPQTVNCS